MNGIGKYNQNFKSAMEVMMNASWSFTLTNPMKDHILILSSIFGLKKEVKDY